MNTCCDFQRSAQPWIFNVKSLNSYIYIGMRGLIDTEGKRYVDRVLIPTMWPSAMTLTWDFQGEILKMLYLRNGRAHWHGIKGMWVDRMLNPCCDFQRSPHPWPWHWIFKVKFWKYCISWMVEPIDMEQKGCESIECWTHVTFNVQLNHDLDLGFSRQNL